jgi:hypothetical protein
MTPGRIDPQASETVEQVAVNGFHPRSKPLFPHDSVHFHPSLAPKKYSIEGTDPDSKILFQDVTILDSTGRQPYKGHVYIEGAHHGPPIRRTLSLTPSQESVSNMWARFLA